MAEPNLELPRKFKNFSGRMTATKEIARLFVLAELPGLFMDIVDYVNEKPDDPFIEHVGGRARIRSELSHVAYDNFLLERDLLTPEGKLSVLAVNLFDEEAEKLEY